MDVRQRQLKYFVTIVDACSLSKAAERLFVAQPSLSQQIANLESELGTQLLLRSSTGVVRHHAGRAAQQQLGTKLAFQVGDIVAERRLGDEQALSSTGCSVDDGDEI